MEEVGAWISDEESFFAHLPITFGGYRQTYCGINLGLGGTYVPADDLRSYAEGKPECSACKDGVRM